MFKNRDERDKYWNDMAKQLVGRKIVAASYMSAEEADATGWSHRAVVLQLDDHSLLFPQSDDEGNDAGVLFHQRKGDDYQILPVLS